MALSATWDDISDPLSSTELNKACILYLDKIEEFDRMVERVLESEYVIGELFFGNSRTTRSELWLNKFTCHAKISIILHVSFDRCYERAETRPEYADKSEEQYKMLYYGFKFLCLFNVFNQYARIKEVCINPQSDLASLTDTSWGNRNG